MEQLSNSALELLALIAVIAAIVAFINLSRRNVRERTKRLQLAAKALSAHYGAVEKLTEDPAVPDQVKQFLGWLPAMLSDKECALRLRDALESGFKLDPSVESQDVLQEILRLEKSRPDLVSAFHVAISSAIAVLYLRWPSEDDAYQRLSVEMATDSRRENALAKKLTDVAKKFTDNNGGNHRKSNMIAA